MGTIFWFIAGLVTGVVFDEGLTRAWKYMKARAAKAAADLDD